MEAVIFFALGYFTRALIAPSGPDLKNPDRILRWDETIFAWRPVLPGSSVSRDETILFAYEVKRDTDRDDQ